MILQDTSSFQDVVYPPTETTREYTKGLFFWIAKHLLMAHVLCRYVRTYDVVIKNDDTAPYLTIVYEKAFRAEVFTCFQNFIEKNNLPFLKLDNLSVIEKGRLPSEEKVTLMFNISRMEKVPFDRYETYINNLQKRSLHKSDIRVKAKEKFE